MFHHEGEDLLDEEAGPHAERGLGLWCFCLDADVSKFFGGDAAGDGWVVFQFWGVRGDDFVHDVVHFLGDAGWLDEQRAHPSREGVFGLVQHLNSFFI